MLLAGGVGGCARHAPAPTTPDEPSRPWTPPASPSALVPAPEKHGVFFDAELHRLKGEMLLLQDATDSAAAEKQFDRARRMARRQCAKSLELRASVSLGRSLLARGRRDEARAAVAAIFDWFTEGHRTADLQEAGALLAELS